MRLAVPAGSAACSREQALGKGDGSNHPDASVPRQRRGELLTDHDVELVLEAALEGLLEAGGLRVGVGHQIAEQAEDKVELRAVEAPEVVQEGDQKGAEAAQVGAVVACEGR